MSLTTMNDIKTFLGISLSDTSKDAIITMFKDSVEQSIINYCESDFSTKVVTNEVLDGVLSDIIVPKNFPVLSVQQVVIGNGIDNSGGLTLATNDYYFDESSIILKINTTPFYRSSVKIDYTYGYSTVPADVKMCVYQAVKAELQRYESNTENVSSRSKEGESESLGASWDSISGLPKQIISKLQSYRSSYEFPNISMSQRNY